MARGLQNHAGAAVAGQFRGSMSCCDLENPEDLARLADPMPVLKQHRVLAVIDEIQRLPDLFPVLRVLAGRTKRPARFIILGSASPELLQSGSETLAERVSFHHLKGFSLTEVGSENPADLRLRGDFPRSYLTESQGASHRWRRDFIRTFLERDSPH